MHGADTGIAIVDWALGLLAAPWGYLIVLGFTISENVFILGTFTPGETVVVAAAFVASRGGLDLWTVWLASVIGGTLGSNIGYLIGRKGGREALLRFGDRLHFSEKRIQAAEEYFDRHGAPTVFIARFAAGVKNLVPMIAGASRMKVGWFELYTVLGAMAQTSVMVALGYFVGANIDIALKIASQIGIAGLAVFAGLVLLALFGRRRYVASKVEELVEESEAEAAEEDGEGGLLDEVPVGGMDDYEP